jgi:hypothetical protein
MELVVETPFSVNRGRKRDAPALDCFGAKVKTLLLRTRGAMEACALTTVDTSFAVLADLDAFGDVTTVDEVEERLVLAKLSASKTRNLNVLRVCSLLCLFSLQSILNFSSGT